MIFILVEVEVVFASFRVASKIKAAPVVQPRLKFPPPRGGGGGGGGYEGPAKNDAIVNRNRL